MMPHEVEGEPDFVSVDTTWGELQPMEAAPGVRTVGELELIELASDGAVVVDARSQRTLGRRTIPDSVNVPHDELNDRRRDLDPTLVSIFFCNGPQCPQSPNAIRELVEGGYPPASLAYYRGGMHDWVTLAMPTAPAGD